MSMNRLARYRLTCPPGCDKIDLGKDCTFLTEF
jgi:hypothetical protein